MPHLSISNRVDTLFNNPYDLYAPVFAFIRSLEDPEASSPKLLPLEQRNAIYEAKKTELPRLVTDIRQIPLLLAHLSERAAFGGFE